MPCSAGHVADCAAATAADAGRSRAVTAEVSNHDSYRSRGNIDAAVTFAILQTRKLYKYVEDHEAVCSTLLQGVF